MANFNQQSQNVDSQYNAGKDQFIQNIVLVGQFLDFAKIEGLIPKPSSLSDFQSVISAFENTFDRHLGNDLAQATATAGEILKESIVKWTPKDSFSGLPLKEILKELPTDLYINLRTRNLWNAFFEEGLVYYHGNIEFIRLSSLEILWKKYFKADCIWGIGCASSYTDIFLFCQNLTFKNHIEAKVNNLRNVGISPLYVESISYEKFRVIIAGIVIDLIRLSSVASNDVKFWKNIAESLKIERAG
jgi:hypothetical protein